MRIGQLADETGVTTKTIRYYEGIGLLPPPARQPSGYRSYASADIDRLDFVAKAKALGLSLEEIGDILRASSPDAVNCAHVVDLLTSKRDELEHWIRDAESLRDALDHTIQASRAGLDSSSAAYHCPVIEHGLHERALHLDGAVHEVTPAHESVRK
ncbi:MAG: heavy metal-responsive transcriptional regulator [Chloroflexi bacterium]|nr:heavy metal-responsive transcriptional regulator [Chloroflexota bacterium]